MAKFQLEFSDVNLITFLAIMLIGGIIAVLSVCSCIDCSPLGKIFTGKKEGFENAAQLGYQMGHGVPGDTWAAQPRQSSQDIMNTLYASLGGNVASVPNLDDNLFFFQDTNFYPECCFTPNGYSSSTGCACISPEQMKFLSGRGGNNNI